ncbi:MAG: hypothetical protein H7Y36_00885 [Armatimonadetes bacterium]|nr:hypothetical protein [Akkermansiaceae bacterium]
MKKPTCLAAFLIPAILIFSAILTSTWLRIGETPPWRTKAASPELQAESHASAPGNQNFTPFRFATYNVKNWLISTQSPEKSTASKNAIISILTAAKPDVIGLCEIGSARDIAEIRRLLRASGLDLPHTYHSGGSDRVRHLGIISRFPITSAHRPDLHISGKDYFMQRGILDVTLRIGQNQVRFIGLHLKSKRIVHEFDQELVRIEEATRVRQHIDSILGKNPDALVIAYGDFNDTTRSLSTRIIFGKFRTPYYLAPVHAKDSRGESWTHYFALQDSYSRIDYVTTSQAMKRHVDKKNSFIIDNPLWEIASDHRPILVGFR